MAEPQLSNQVELDTFFNVAHEPAELDLRVVLGQARVLESRAPLAHNALLMALELLRQLDPLQQQWDRPRLRKVAYAFLSLLESLSENDGPLDPLSRRLRFDIRPPWDGGCGVGGSSGGPPHRLSGVGLASTWGVGGNGGVGGAGGAPSGGGGASIGATSGPVVGVGSNGASQSISDGYTLIAGGGVSQEYAAFRASCARLGPEKGVPEQ